MCHPGRHGQRPGCVGPPHPGPLALPGDRRVGRPGRRHLRLGAAFDAHPSLEEACRRGQLSGPKAHLVADAARANPGREDELVDGARTDSLRQVKDRCARVKAEARSAKDAEAAYEAIRSSRHCRTWTDRDGAFRLDARLTPDAGAALLATLTTEADARFARARQAGVRDTPDAYRADALVDLVTGRPGAGDGPSVDERGHRRGGCPDPGHPAGGPRRPAPGVARARGAL